MNEVLLCYEGGPGRRRGEAAACGVPCFARPGNTVVKHDSVLLEIIAKKGEDREVLQSTRLSGGGAMIAKPSCHASIQF